MIRLVIFDWDGVLYDSYRINSEALDEMLKHFGREPLGESNWHKLYRADYMALYREMGMTQSQEEIWQIYQEKLRQKPFGKFFPHAEDTLRWLHERNVTVVIVSMAVPWVIEAVLEKHALRKYVARIYAGMKHQEKLETIKNLIGEFSGKPEETIYIDDHDHFIREAKKFGCITMAFLYGGYHKRELLIKVHPDYPISSIDSIQRHINFLNRKQAGELDPRPKRIIPV